MTETQHTIENNKALLAQLEQNILFEDTRFMFINKPSGLASHGVSGASLGLIESLRVLRPNSPYLELGHRLDKGTSGCIVIAKRKSALRAFQKQQESRGVDKHYLALVKGQWRGSYRKVDAPILKVSHEDGSWSVRASDKGKRAVSYFSPVQRFKESTLVRVKIITGRTHQIRVHAASLTQPIAGDSIYGETTFNQNMQKLGLNRLFLHAASIQFKLEQAEYDIQAPLDECLQKVLVKLEEDIN